MFLYNVKSDDFIHNGFIMGQYFLTIFFVAFDVVMLSDSNSNFNNFIEVHLLNFFSQLIG